MEFDTYIGIIFGIIGAVLYGPVLNSIKRENKVKTILFITVMLLFAATLFYKYDISTIFSKIKIISCIKNCIPFFIIIYQIK